MLNLPLFRYRKNRPDATFGPLNLRTPFGYDFRFCQTLHKDGFVPAIDESAPL